MGNKLCPKVILEGTRLTFKTEIAFELNEHPRVVGPRKCPYAPRGIRQFCRLQDEDQSVMRMAMSPIKLSACAYHCTRSAKLAHTIGDRAGSEEIQSVHLANTGVDSRCQCSFIRRRQKGSEAVQNLQG